MKDKFDILLSILTEKTKNLEISWTPDEKAGHFHLELKDNIIQVVFRLNLKKKASYPIFFKVFNKNHELIEEFEEIPNDRYYNRLHALCRVIKGKDDHFDQTLDNMIAELS